MAWARKTKSGRVDTLTHKLQSGWSFRPYSDADRVTWNQFVAESRNATFLFRREYMEYHSDRFTDGSLMAYLNGKLSAILPASLRDDTLSSHGGLTYGGWVLPRNRIDGTEVMELFSAWISHSREMGLKRLVYKPLPYIYTLYPSQEDIFALTRHGFKIADVRLSSAVNMAQRRPFNVTKRRQLRDTLNERLTVSESTDFRAYWRVLEECLRERHGAVPVHTCAEIERLATLLPGCIRLFTVSDADGIQAGAVIFDTGLCAHCQYIASTATGRDRNMLTLLFHQLIGQEFPQAAYFDFGTSNDPVTGHINTGLLRQKFSLGASGVAYPTYSLEL